MVRVMLIMYVRCESDRPEEPQPWLIIAPTPARAPWILPNLARADMWEVGAQISCLARLYRGGYHAFSGPALRYTGTAISPLLLSAIRVNATGAALVARARSRGG